MALREKQKDKLRRWIRVAMVFVAVILLLFAVIVPVGNNAVALGVENDLKAIPLPEKTERVETISKAGRFGGNDMQYFGAVLIKSDLPLDELVSYYQEHDCHCAGQLSAEILVSGGEVTFRHEDYDDTYFVVYRWGSAPAWMRDWLNTDLRAN